MKTNLSTSVMVHNGAGSSFLHKLFVSALVISLLFASLPVHAALAAPASDGSSVRNERFEQVWSNKLLKVRYNGIFYQTVRAYPADFDDLDELAKAHDILNNYGVALRAAQRIVVNSAGFDTKGRVTNAALAEQSLRDLSEYLRQMRVLRQKLDRLDGKLRFVPLSATTSASQ